MDGLQQERNAQSKKIGQMKAKGEDTTEVMASVEGLKGKLQALETDLRDIQAEFDTVLSVIPNAPHSSVPVGAGEEENVEVSKWGTPTEFSFEPKDHVDIGEGIEGIDFADAAKISGARFVVMKGPIARMHRAIAQVNNEHGPPRMPRARKRPKGPIDRLRCVVFFQRFCITHSTS